MVLEQLAVTFGDLFGVTAVLYYLGNFPDVFSFDLLRSLDPSSSWSVFLMHGPIDL